MICHFTNLVVILKFMTYTRQGDIPYWRTDRNIHQVRSIQWEDREGDHIPMVTLVLVKRLKCQSYDRAQQHQLLLSTNKNNIKKNTVAKLGRGSTGYHHYSWEETVQCNQLSTTKSAIVNLIDQENSCEQNRKKLPTSSVNFVPYYWALPYRARDPNLFCLQRKLIMLDQ